jgi:hypothetical protein
MAELTTPTDDVLSRWKGKKWIAYVLAAAAVVGGVATFTDSLAKIYTNLVAVLGHKTVKTTKLPFDTGWILAGYYDPQLAKYTQGPYVEVAKTSYPDKQTLPRVGDWVRVTGERNVIIASFATTGLAQQMNAPLADLSQGDYTGVKLPTGATMEVRDVGGGSYPDRATAVWLRIGNIPQ